MNFPAPGSCQAVAVSTTSAICAAFKSRAVFVTPTIDCFARYSPTGSTVTALSTGVDYFMLAGATQAFDVAPGARIAFITSVGTGTVYIAEVG